MEVILESVREYEENNQDLIDYLRGDRKSYVVFTFVVFGNSYRECEVNYQQIIRFSQKYNPAVVNINIQIVSKDLDVSEMTYEATLAFTFWDSLVACKFTQYAVLDLPECIISNIEVVENDTTIN